MGGLYAFVLTAAEATDVLLLYAILWMIATGFGILIFRFDNFLAFNNLYSFLNFIRSSITTFVFIISVENYCQVVYPTVNYSPALVTYFVILTVVGSFIVVSLVVSQFQKSFKLIHNCERTRRKYFKRTGYVAAFSLINLDNDNQVSQIAHYTFGKIDLITAWIGIIAMTIGVCGSYLGILIIFISQIYLLNITRIK